MKGENVGGVLEIICISLNRVTRADTCLRKCKHSKSQRAFNWDFVSHLSTFLRSKYFLANLACKIFKPSSSALVMA